MLLAYITACRLNLSTVILNRYVSWDTQVEFQYCLPRDSTYTELVLEQIYPINTQGISRHSALAYLTLWSWNWTFK